MKEMVKKHKTEIAVGTCVVVMTTLAVCCARRAYFNGFQWGCDTTFRRITKEFPDSDFYKKYHG